MRWRNKDGKVRTHPAGHHAHATKTGQPIYHEDAGVDACLDVQFHGQGLLARNDHDEWGAYVSGAGRDHHGGLDHEHGSKS